MNTTSRVVRIASAVGLLIALGLLAACASGPAATPRVEAESSPQPTEPLTIKLTLPAAGADVPAGDLNVAVETTGLKFTMPGGANVAGEGHVHFTLDDRPEVMSVEAEAEIKDVEPGAHTLVAELVQNDTEPFDPPVKTEIEFVAK